MAVVEQLPRVHTYTGAFGRRLKISGRGEFYVYFPVFEEVFGPLRLESAVDVADKHNKRVEEQRYDKLWRQFADTEVPLKDCYAYIGQKSV